MKRDRTMNSTDNDGAVLDQGLDAEDIEAAVAQRAEEQLNSGKVREAFYNSYCYLRDLQEFAIDARNTELKYFIKQSLEHLETSRKVLDDNYKWD
jgi:hypothetical protein